MDKTVGDVVETEVRGALTTGFEERSDWEDLRVALTLEQRCIATSGSEVEWNGRFDGRNALFV
jgi:hypothetical protein